MDALEAETPMRVTWVTPGFSLRSQGTRRFVTGHAALEDPGLCWYPFSIIHEQGSGRQDRGEGRGHDSEDFGD